VSHSHGHNNSKTTGPTPTYRSWAKMKERCDNPNSANYKYYGGRGVAYTPEWADFNAFLRDMGERPEGTWLERLDNEAPYSKDNCVWLSPCGQAQNRRMPCTNTSGVKGVNWHKRWGRWEAAGMRNGVRYFLYSGHSFEEACQARLLWEKGA